MAAWNVINGYIWGGGNWRDSNRQDDQAGPPVENPPARQAFVAVSARVAQSLTNIDRLSARLRARHMEVNATDLAASYRMQGFLEDAAALIQKENFGEAKFALDRANYERRRIRSATGE
jgi:hypothetical protein